MDTSHICARGASRHHLYSYRDRLRILYEVVHFRATSTDIKICLTVNEDRTIHFVHFLLLGGKSSLHAKPE